MYHSQVTVCVICHSQVTACVMYQSGDDGIDGGVVAVRKLSVSYSGDGGGGGGGGGGNFGRSGD